MTEDREYRIRANVGDSSEKVVYVKMDQTYDIINILSLKMNQANAYKFYKADYGVLVGRVYVNGGFGVPNAKVSIFIETDEKYGTSSNYIYPYTSIRGTNSDGIRYNLLPDSLDSVCYQNVGTFPNKRLVLDNNDYIEVFDKYYKYTTTTNNAGDYMIFGIPTGNYTLHVDVDLSDIGILSQRPRDMMYKGYNAEMFESPNKFKTSTNLDSLPQIITQNQGVIIYPYWGDNTDEDAIIGVSRCDISLDYKIEPTCVFMGSIVTSTNGDSITKDCSSREDLGKMEKLVAGQGTIEMIRKTFDNRVEQFSIKGNELIDSNGVWCYQIPMNLDYIKTDEFGNIVPSDNPEIGIPTRTRVRFRVSVHDMSNDGKAANRCKYLVPNNPISASETRDDGRRIRYGEGADYEFGTRTKEDSFRDLLWNKVYTVKNYIPRVQTNGWVSNRKHSGIKLINHHGDNNPIPFNHINLHLGFQYKMLCIIIKLFIKLIGFLNNLLSLIAIIPCILYNFFNAICKALKSSVILSFIAPLFCGIAWIFDQIIPTCIAISSEFCGDYTTHRYTFYPGCGKFLGISMGEFSCIKNKTQKVHNKKQVNGVEVEDRTIAMFGSDELYNCVETQLAESNDVISLNFANDWINGMLYMPLWHRRIREKQKFLGLITIHRAKDEWCSANITYNKARIFQPCAIMRTRGKSYVNMDNVQHNANIMGSDAEAAPGDQEKCDRIKSYVPMGKGIVKDKKTILDQTVYYYKPVAIGNERERATTDTSYYQLEYLFATDIVLLGSLNDFDMHGIPQFFKRLSETTYNIPPNLLFTNNVVTVDFKKSGDNTEVVYVADEESTTEATGMDWGNNNNDLCDGNSRKNSNSGLFFGIGCSAQEVIPKSCINLARICEYGVTMDSTKSIPNIDNLRSSSGNEFIEETLVPDGFISKDEIYDEVGRSAFATMNGNGLKTRINPENGLVEYVFKPLVVDNFDGSLYEVMKNKQMRCNKTPRFNFYLETFSEGYYDFRMGSKPTFYDKGTNVNGNSFPRYENSFYFYFGLKHGKTAIDRFNSDFFSNCENDGELMDKVNFFIIPGTWCSTLNEDSDSGSYVGFDLTNIDLPCDIVLTPRTKEENSVEYSFNNISDEKIYVSKSQIQDLEDDDYIQYKDENNNTIDIKVGEYNSIITDNSGNVYEDIVDTRPDMLEVDIVKSNFSLTGDELLDIYGDYQNIATHKENDEIQSPFTTSSSRKIGGTITVGVPTDGATGDPIENYVITIDVDEGSLIGNDSDILNYAVRVEMHNGAISGDTTYVLGEEDGIIVFGLPKDNEKYTVTVRELCYDDGLYVECNNIHSETFEVGIKRPFKLYINDVDYDVISHWNCGFTVTEENGTKKITGDGSGMSDNWLHMSDISRYNWNKYNEYNDIDKDIVDLFKQLQALINGYKLDDDARYEVYDTLISFLVNQNSNVSTIENRKKMVAGEYSKETVTIKSETFLYCGNSEIDWAVVKDVLDLENLQLNDLRYTINAIIDRYVYNNLSLTEKAKYIIYEYIKSENIKVINKPESGNASEDSISLINTNEYWLYYGIMGGTNLSSEEINGGGYILDTEPAPEDISQYWTFNLGNETKWVSNEISKLYYVYTNADKVLFDEYENISNVPKGSYNCIEYIKCDKVITNPHPLNAVPADLNPISTEDSYEYWLYCGEMGGTDFSQEELINGGYILDTEPEDITQYWQFDFGNRTKWVSNDITALYFTSGEKINSSICDELGNEEKEKYKPFRYEYVDEITILTLTYFEWQSYKCKNDYEMYRYINTDTFKVTLYITYNSHNYSITYENKTGYTQINSYGISGRKYYIKENVTPSSDEVNENDLLAADFDEVIGLNNEVIVSLQKVEEVKTTFINYVKSTFTLNCEEENKMITFNVDTDDLPAKSYTVYRGEHLPDDLPEEDAFNVLDNKDTVEDEESFMIENITIPTITRKDSERFGSNNHPLRISGYNDLCFARDNYYRETSDDRYWKKSLFVKAENSIKLTKPQDGSYFGFHIIDKVFSFKIITWSYIISIPYFNPSDSIKNGETVTLCGFTAGKIYNGVIMSREPENLHITNFRTQSIGNAELKIYTKWGNAIGSTDIQKAINAEDNIPTERIIIGNKDDIDVLVAILNRYTSDYQESLGIGVVLGYTNNIKTFDKETFDALEDKEGYYKVCVVYNLTNFKTSITEAELPDYVNIGSRFYKKLLIIDETLIKNYKCYKNYCVDSSLMNLFKEQYILISPGEQSLSLSDENACTIYKQVGSLMRIRLDSDSINDCRKDKSFAIEETSAFGVYVDNVATSKTIFLAFEVNGTDQPDYPLNKASKMSVSTINLPLSTINVNNNGDCGVFSKNNPEYLFSWETVPLINKTRKTAMLGGKNCDNSGTNGVKTTSLLKSSTDGYNGYSEDGFFTLTDDKTSNAKSHKPFYIVAITEDNTRTISPVYDFSIIGAIIKFGSVVTSNGMKSCFTVDVNNAQNVYYINNFEYKVEATLVDYNGEDLIYDISYTHPAYKVSKTGELFPTDNISSTYLDYIERGVWFGDADYTTMITDYVGLRHTVLITARETGFKWITVRFNPNGGLWKPNNSFIESYLYGTSDIWEKIYEVDSGTTTLNSPLIHLENIGGYMTKINEYGISLGVSEWIDESGNILPLDTIVNVSNLVNVGTPINKTYTAVWGNGDTTNSWKVTWKYGGNGDNADNVYHTDYVSRDGICLDKPSNNPTRPDANFVGWVSSNGTPWEELVADGRNCVIINENMTFIGNWIESRYYVRVAITNDLGNEGELPNPKICLDSAYIECIFKDEQHNTYTVSGHCSLSGLLAKNATTDTFMLGYINFGLGNVSSVTLDEVKLSCDIVPNNASNCQNGMPVTTEGGNAIITCYVQEHSKYYEMQISYI